MKFKALIFDVDGTLTDTNQVHADNWKNAFDENGLFVDYEEVKKLVGKGGDNLIPDILGYKPSKEIEKNLTNAKGEEFKKSSKEQKFELFSKAVEILVHCK